MALLAWAVSVSTFFQQRGNVGMVLRVIPTKIPHHGRTEPPARNLQNLRRAARVGAGYGTTGSGKSTTLAAMIDRINAHRADHLITIEDPIEFLHRDKKSFINQRESRSGHRNFSTALRAALRQDPDVILVAKCATRNDFHGAARRGNRPPRAVHPAHSRRHGNDQRIIAVFPPPEQKQIPLAACRYVEGGRLAAAGRRADDKGRVPACEIMIATGYIRDCIINADKTRLIHDAIAAGTSQYGMQTSISRSSTSTRSSSSPRRSPARASNPDEFKLRIQGIRSASDSAARKWPRNGRLRALRPQVVVAHPSEVRTLECASPAMNPRVTTLACGFALLVPAWFGCSFQFSYPTLPNAGSNGDSCIFSDKR